MCKLFVLCVWCGFASIVLCHAQLPAASPPDPKALMLAASKFNNLATPDAKPWHIKAAFQLFDEQGAVTDEGVYEEFWASAFRFKRTFTGKNFSQTAYGSKSGVLLTCTQEEPDLLLAARNNLVHPLPDGIVIEHTTYTTKPLNSGSFSVSSLQQFLPVRLGIIPCTAWTPTTRCCVLQLGLQLLIRRFITGQCASKIAPSPER